ncbi:MAG: hypothetical protein IPP47_07660 [Bryobacterales bacterium]|nr:hypothetical protein [Bryobacterales bacterium]
MRFRFLQKRRDEAETFTGMVEERGRILRALPYDQLARLADEPTMEVVVGNRKGQVGVVVEQCEGDQLKVVVQGFINAFERLPMFKGVALHGFYKHRDGTVTEMGNEEFYGYD